MPALCTRPFHSTHIRTTACPYTGVRNAQARNIMKVRGHGCRGRGIFITGQSLHGWSSSDLDGCDTRTHELRAQTHGALRWLRVLHVLNQCAVMWPQLGLQPCTTEAGLSQPVPDAAAPHAPALLSPPLQAARA